MCFTTYLLIAVSVEHSLFLLQCVVVCCVSVGERVGWGVGICQGGWRREVFRLWNEVMYRSPMDDKLEAWNALYELDALRHRYFLVRRKWEGG